jgi:peroxiredoxin Q/BCP
MPSSDKLKSHKADIAPAKKQPKEGAAPNASVALEGKKAPNFELPDESGKAVRLKDLIGSKALVLYFYPKDMTPGCTMQACSFRDNESKLRAAGARVVGISGDSSASHTKFIEKQSLNFPLLADPSHKVSTAYGVYKMKSLYGREYMGIERTTFVIDKTGLVRKVFPKVKVNGHSDEVLAALKELH